MLATRSYPALCPPPCGFETLSKTEREVLKRIYLRNKIIADNMNISRYTVDSHVQNMLLKTGLQNKIELGICADRKGLIE